MPKYTWRASYTEWQTCVGSGDVWGTIEADSVEEAIAKLKKLNEDSVLEWDDSHEDDCELRDTDGMNIDLDELEVYEDED